VEHQLLTSFYWVHVARSLVFCDVNGQAIIYQTETMQWRNGQAIIYQTETMQWPNGQAIIYQTETMQWPNGQAIIYQTHHRKLKIEQRSITDDVRVV
jgi:sulfate adenylyltransferase subunit 1 (EFTu-like GTPase family)